MAFCKGKRPEHVIRDAMINIKIMDGGLLFLVISLFFFGFVSGMILHDLFISLMESLIRFTGK